MLREATIDDARAMEVARAEAWRAVYGPLVPPGTLDGMDLERSIERREEQLARPGPVRLTVAGTGSEVEAFAAMGPYRGDDLLGTTAVYALYARPAAWSRGLGRALMDDALAFLPRPTVLWVLCANTRARRFYERSGFRDDGVTRTFDLLGVPLPETRYRYRDDPDRERFAVPHPAAVAASSPAGPADSGGTGR